MHVKHHKSCRICGNQHLTEVLDLGMQHIQGAFDHPDAPSPPRRKVSNRIVRCDTSKDENACGLVQADVSVSPEILYRNYWYQSGISQTMTNHLQGIAKEAMKIVGANPLEVVNVLDLAANDGSLLRGYPDTFARVGVDPSNIAAKQTDVRIINEVFPTKELDHEVESYKIITSIACFYDINDPYRFVSSIKKLLKRDGIWAAEFAYLPNILTDLAYSQILLEHCCHYHLAPFERLLKDAKMKLFRAEKTPTNGGSIMVYVCREDCDKYNQKEWSDNLSKLRFEEFEMELDEQHTYDKFQKDVITNLRELKDLLVKLKDEGKSVHLYGASTKMNVILEAAEIGPDLIPYAAERSKEKWGGSTLSGVKLISEVESRSLSPSYYICSLIGFKDEIIVREEEYLNNGGAFIFLPSLEIVKQ